MKQPLSPLAQALIRFMYEFEIYDEAGEDPLVGCADINQAASDVGDALIREHNSTIEFIASLAVKENLDEGY